MLLSAAALNSCSSDNGSKKSDKTKTKTEYVSVTPMIDSDAGYDFTENDVLYVCNRSIGEKGTISMLKYDAVSRQFKGNITYSNADDRMYSFIKFAGTPKVEVDTASRKITIDYQNQNGTLTDAHSRNYAYTLAATASSYTNPQASIRFAMASAYICVKKAGNANARTYHLSSTGNRMETKASLTSYPLYFASQTEVCMYDGRYIPTDITRISCSVNPDGDTHIAFHAQPVANPVLESDITLESGVNIIENDNLQGSSTTAADENGISASTFENGKTYNVNVTGKAEAGTFLCDQQFNVKAIVYDTENVNQDGFHTARAMAVNDAGKTAAWSKRETLPGSSSEFITSSPVTDLRGYEISTYFKGNADYTAISLAANHSAPLRSCSEWYLPSVGEWNNFWNNLGGIRKINLMLRQAGAPEISSFKYWTSSLHTLTEPFVMTENSGSISPYTQPLHSQNAVRASILF